MSHSSNINLVRLTKEEIEALGDELRNASGFVTRCIMVGPGHTGIQDGRKICDDLHKEFTGIDTTKPGGDYSETKHTGWIVLQRLRHHDGKLFIAPTFRDTKPEAEMFASNFDNIVAIMPIEWEK